MRRTTVPGSTSAAGRVATCSPSRSTVTVSTRPSSSSSRCEIRMIETPRAARRRATRNRRSVSAGRERGGGLVEDQEAVDTLRHGARELDELRLADRQARHGRGRLDRRVDLSEELPRPLVHPAAVDGAEPGQRLEAHEDVLGHVEVREQLRVLVDRDHAARPGRHRRGEAHRLAVEPDLARIGLLDAGDDADQRALAGAVLAQDGVDRARGDGEAHALERADAAEALAHAVKGEAGCHGAGVTPDPPRRRPRPRPVGCRRASPR